MSNVNISPHIATIFGLVTYKNAFIAPVMCLCRTPKEMLEKIAELDYNQSQLKSLNAEMRQWLDVADDEVATLRSENVILRKQLNT